MEIEMNKRTLLFAGAATAVITLPRCTPGTTTLDPAAIANAIKIACGIAVPAATVLEVINAAAGATASLIISLVCSSYKNALAAKAGGGAKLAAGAEVNFVVHVCDDAGKVCKDIPITAMAQ
jgi:hypothetical protein